MGAVALEVVRGDLGDGDVLVGLAIVLYCIVLC